MKIHLPKGFIILSLAGGMTATLEHPAEVEFISVTGEPATFDQAASALAASGREDMMPLLNHRSRKGGVDVVYSAIGDRHEFPIVEPDGINEAESKSAFDKRIAAEKEAEKKAAESAIAKVETEKAAKKIEDEKAAAEKAKKPSK